MKIKVLKCSNEKKSKKNIISNKEIEDNIYQNKTKFNFIQTQPNTIPVTIKDPISATFKAQKAKQQTLDFFGITVPKANKDSLFIALPPKVLKIITWNINGLRAVINRKEGQDLICKEKPDIGCLNETKISQISLREEKIEYIFNKDYLTYWNFSERKKGYSGVSIFSKYKPLKITYGINIQEHDQEGRVITMFFDKLVIICVYVPNSGSDRFEYRTKEWDIALRNYIGKIKTDNKENTDIIITGDGNVCHKEIDIYDFYNHGDKPPFTKEERDNLTELLNGGFVDAFREGHPDEIKYTWFNNTQDILMNRGYRGDYFIVNKEARDKIASVSIENQYLGSDHFAIKMLFNYI